PFLRRRVGATRSSHHALGLITTGGTAARAAAPSAPLTYMRTHGETPACSGAWRWCGILPGDAGPSQAAGAWPRDADSPPTHGRTPGRSVDRLLARQSPAAPCRLAICDTP